MKIIYSLFIDLSSTSLLQHLKHLKLILHCHQQRDLKNLRKNVEIFVFFEFELILYVCEPLRRVLNGIV